MSVRRLRLQFIAYGAALGFLFPWNVPQLTQAGLDPGQIGAVLGVAALVSLVAYPAWGLIADTIMGRERTLVLAALSAAAAGVGIAVSADAPWALAAFVVLALVCVAPWAPISDALALGALGGRARDYGRMRSGTSAGWIGGVLVAGLVHTAWGVGPVRVLFVVASLVLAAAVAGGRGGAVARRGAGRTGTVARPSLASVRVAMRASPTFLPFLVVLFVASVATNAAYAFLSLRILDEGGGPLLIAVASAMPALVEIPVFGMIGRLTDRFGLRALFAAGCLLSGAQMLIVAAAPVPAVIAVVRLLDGAGFALRYSSIVLIAGASMPGHLRATAQAFASQVTGGIAPVVSGPLGGWVYGAYGGGALFLACAGLLGLAAGMAWSVLRPLRSAGGAAGLEPVHEPTAGELAVAAPAPDP